MSCPASPPDQATPPVTPVAEVTSTDEGAPTTEVSATRPRWQNDFPDLFQRTTRAINGPKRPYSNYNNQENFMELRSMEKIILRQARYVYTKDPSPSTTPTFEIISYRRRSIKLGELEVDRPERGLVSAMLIVSPTDVTPLQIVAESGSHDSLRQAYEELLAQTQKSMLGVVEFRPNTAVECPSGKCQGVYGYRPAHVWVVEIWLISVVCIIWFSFGDGLGVCVRILNAIVDRMPLQSFW